MSRARGSIVLLAALLAGIPGAMAQRLIPGQYMLDAQVGGLVWEPFWRAPANFSLHVGLSRYLRGYHYLRAEAGYLHAHYRFRRAWVPVDDWIASVGYHRWLLGTPGREALWHVSGYACVGFEEVNGGRAHLPRLGTIRSRSTWVAGFQLGTGLDVYLADRLQLLIRARAMCLFHSQLFPVRPSLAVGFRWCF